MPRNPTTSKVSTSLRKLAAVPKQMGRSIWLRGWTRFPGAMLWNDDLLGRSLSKPIPMSSKVCAYMMLRLLPSSMSTLEKRVLPMMGSTMSGYCLGFGT